MNIITKPKETSFVKDLILPYIKEGIRGIDIGFGGDKIREDFLGCDLPRPYGSSFGHSEFYNIDIACDVSKGIPAEDNSFDVVYSSHLIEDFVDTKKILKEFLRICKSDGRMILVFPNQKKYEKYCRKRGEEPNGSHKIPEMGISYMVKQLAELDCVRDEIMVFEKGSYNCIIIFDVKK